MVCIYCDSSAVKAFQTNKDTVSGKVTHMYECLSCGKEWVNETL